ncbi:uncharacterized protein wntD [Ochlerotatus camptorhynchus]|uniref:uncharacterized protein wntD n=1 Tax=Ochlerotatus camptorhynchus TaxID=644619 RepID=UPI0031D04055
MSATGSTSLILLSLLCTARASDISIYQLGPELLSNSIELALSSCRSQFRWEPWNCPTMQFLTKRIPTATLDRETAFVRALSTASMIYVYARNCSRGSTLDACGCDQCDRETLLVEGFDRLDAKGYGNAHNRRAGWVAVRNAVRGNCRCHGVSGSCAMRTCWSTMKTFAAIAAGVKRMYAGSVRLFVDNTGKLNTEKIREDQLAYIHPLSNNATCDCEQEMEISRLNKIVDRLQHQLIKGRRGMAWIANNDMCRRYTGINMLTTLKRLYNFMEPVLFDPACHLTKDEVFVMTLRELRRNTPFCELADEYSVCTNTASKFFHRTAFILFENLKWALSILPKDIAIRHNPLIFQQYFGRRRIFVIDCFEVYSETPLETRAAIAHHSAYKSHQTTKFLIAMNSNGSVAFISQAYGGRCSDRFIANDSGFLNNLESEDVVLADKGFYIRDLVASKGAILNIPTFWRKGSQLNPLSIEKDKQITCLRVHIERLIGVLKSKLTYLKRSITVNALRRFENNQNSILL